MPSETKKRGFRRHNGLTGLTARQILRLSVSYQQLVTPLQPSGKLFDNIDGTVLSSRATDGDGNVAPAFILQTRQPMRNKPFDVVNHFLHKRLSVQIIPDRLVRTGKRPQFKIVIRVGQAALFGTPYLNPNDSKITSSPVRSTFSHCRTAWRSCWAFIWEVSIQ